MDAGILGRRGMRVMRHLSQCCKSGLQPAGLFLMLRESSADGSTAKQAGVHRSAGSGRGTVNGGERRPTGGRRVRVGPEAVPGDPTTSSDPIGRLLGSDRGNHPQVERVFGPGPGGYAARRRTVRVGKDGRTDAVEVSALRVEGRDGRVSAGQGAPRRGVQWKTVVLPPAGMERRRKV